MKKKDFDRQQRFSIRKLTVGAASVLIGTTFYLASGQTVHADTVNDNQIQTEQVVSNTNNSAQAKQTDTVKDDQVQTDQVDTQNLDNKVPSGLANAQLSKSDDAQTVNSKLFTSVSDDQADLNGETNSTENKQSMANGQGENTSSNSDTNQVNNLNNSQENSSADDAQNQSDNNVTVVNDNRNNTSYTEILHYRFNDQQIADDTVIKYDLHRDYTIDNNTGKVTIGKWTYVPNSLTQTGTHIDGIGQVSDPQSVLDGMDTVYLYIPYIHIDGYNQPYSGLNVSMSVPNTDGYVSPTSDEMTVNYNKNATVTINVIDQDNNNKVIVSQKESNFANGSYTTLKQPDGINFKNYYSVGSTPIDGVTFAGDYWGSFDNPNTNWTIPNIKWTDDAYDKVNGQTLNIYVKHKTIDKHVTVGTSITEQFNYASANDIKEYFNNWNDPSKYDINSSTVGKSYAPDEQIYIPIIFDYSHDLVTGKKTYTNFLLDKDTVNRQATNIHINDIQFDSGWIDIKYTVDAIAGDLLKDPNYKVSKESDATDNAEYLPGWTLVSNIPGQNSTGEINSDGLYTPASYEIKYPINDPGTDYFSSLSYRDTVFAAKHKTAPTTPIAFTSDTDQIIVHDPYNGDKTIDRAVVYGDTYDEDLVTGQAIPSSHRIVVLGGTNYTKLDKEVDILNVDDGSWTKAYATLDEYVAPDVPGYTAHSDDPNGNGTTVAARDATTTHFIENKVYNITYTPNDQTGKIVYIDGDGNEVGNTPIQGKTDEDITITPQIPDGYVITPGQDIPTNEKVPADGIPDIIVKVTKKETQNGEVVNTDSPTAKNIIVYKDGNGDVIGTEDVPGNPGDKVTPQLPDGYYGDGDPITIPDNGVITIDVVKKETQNGEVVDTDSKPFNGGVSGIPEMIDNPKAFTGNVSGIPLTDDPAAYSGAVSGIPFEAADNPEYQGTASNIPLEASDAPEFNGGVSGIPLEAADNPEYQGTASGIPLTQDDKKFNGGVSGIPLTYDEPEFTGNIPTNLDGNNNSDNGDSDNINNGNTNNGKTITNSNRKVIDSLLGGYGSPRMRQNQGDVTANKITKSEESNQNTLPQTGDKDANIFAILGSLLASIGLLGLAGNKKKHEN